MPYLVERSGTEAKAELLKALANPVRLRVLELVAERDQSMGEHAKHTGPQLSHLSRHVTVLRQVGIVGSRRVKTP